MDSNEPLNARRERKRDRDRAHKRLQREQFKAERQLLLDSIRALQKKYYAHQGTLLPWRDVAAGLHDETQESIAENKRLRHATNQYAELLPRLQVWLRRMHIQRLPVQTFESKWSMYLPQDPDIRRIGYDWIAQHMLATTNLYLAPAAFPVALENSVKIEWSLHGGTVTTQTVVPATVDQTSKALWMLNRAAVEYGPESFLSETSCQSLFSSDGADATVYNRELYRGSSTNILHRRIVQDHRTIIMYRWIEDDTLYPILNGPSASAVQEWNEIRAISTTHSLLRTVAVETLAMTTLTSFRDIVRLLKWPCSLDDISSESRAHRVLIARGYWMAKTSKALLEDILQSMSDPDPTRLCLLFGPSMGSPVVRVRSLRFFIALYTAYARYRRNIGGNGLANAFELRHVEFEEQLENLYLLVVHAPCVGDEVLATVQAALIEIMRELRLHFFSSMRSYITRERVSIAVASDKQQVTPGLWIGSTISFADMLVEAGKFPRHFLAVSSTATGDSSFMGQLGPQDTFETLSMDKTETIDWAALVSLVSEKLDKGNTVLVFCETGVSWSGAVCIAFVMKMYFLPYPDAVAVVQAARRFVEPAPPLDASLRAYAGTITVNADTIQLF
ncbi:hypothetical protein ACHHYP_16019 [Achlya hypogyna]|uniref:Tyrosine specific protein phosphatases domain-containing protein n=1 Tax=Achlya hypogyna TaxID=1202772 RepID=A0A1V9ZEC2_ACHHY|nr:hypothetical protein ACHHYP_16019 [Achlya hypogyna]